MEKTGIGDPNRTEGTPCGHGRDGKAPVVPEAPRPLSEARGSAIRIYVDSDVIIWHLRGERRAAALLRSLAGTPGLELWMGAIQRAEIVFFMRREEEAATMSLLSRLRSPPVTQAIVDAAGAFYRRWHPSHGLDVNDALLAATVTSTGGRIVTQNVKHYSMPDVNVQKGW